MLIIKLILLSCHLLILVLSIKILDSRDIFYHYNSKENSKYSALLNISSFSTIFFIGLLFNGYKIVVKGKIRKQFML